jgi:hypothetical protein
VDARVELAPATFAHPWASALVSLAAPRFIREQTDRPGGPGTDVPEEDGCGDHLGSASQRRLGLR